MPKQHIPKGPWDNGIYTSGEYDAVIHSIESKRYGQGTDYYFKIVLWLVQKETFIVTNIYIKQDYQAALKRIYYLCQACRTSDANFYKRLDEFEGKHIGVRLFRMSPKQSGAVNTFSDVKKFLGASKPLREEQWAAYRKATSPQVKTSAAENKPETKKGFVDLFAV
ncbi:MAG: hypothetical protein QUV05_12205 [Phycisphaerae bacterium]|nr:hypothetical protein [Phycisphaerae bacterium]